MRAIIVVTVGEDNIEISGHAKDTIVCHGISAITHMVANYVVMNDLGNVNVDDGYMTIANINEQQRGNDLFQAMMFAIKEIARDYPENIVIKYD